MLRLSVLLILAVTFYGVTPAPRPDDQQLEQQLEQQQSEIGPSVDQEIPAQVRAAAEGGDQQEIQQVLITGPAIEHPDLMEKVTDEQGEIQQVSVIGPPAEADPVEAHYERATARAVKGADVPAGRTGVFRPDESSDESED